MQNIDELRESVGRRVSELSLVGEIVSRPDTKSSATESRTDTASADESRTSEVPSLGFITGVIKRDNWRPWKTQEEIVDEIARWIQRSRDAAAQERTEMLAEL